MTIRILFLFHIIIFSLIGKEYVVPLFDTNSSNGVWQMVGVTGLKLISTDILTTSNSGGDANGNNPIIPIEDRTDTTSSSSDNPETPYNESGISENEVAISSVFDTNLSNNSFDALNSSGTLTMYSYLPISSENKWLYYNSKNSDSDNEFSSLKKGLGYWAKYDDSNLEFSSSNERLSNAGFIFDDAFNMGFETFTAKIFDGWNLLSIPTKRTIENIYLLTIDYSSDNDYNFSIAKHSSFNVQKINLDNNSTVEAVKELNNALNSLDIIAVESGVDEFDSSITLFSRNKFYLQNSSDIQYLTYPDKTTTTSSDRIYAQSLNGLVINFNRDILKILPSVIISLNGEELNISDFASTKIVTSDNSVTGVELALNDGNITLLLSDKDISLQNNNYIKRYENPITSSVPDGFFSIDDNISIFQATQLRDEVNLTLISLQNSEEYSIIKGYSSIVDFADNLEMINNEVLFTKYLGGTHFINTYQYPRNNNLKYFLSHVFNGYIPSQVLTLKDEIGVDGIKWESMPITQNMSDWKDFISRYEPVYNIDKSKAYWVKFIPVSSTKTDFSIDKTQSTIDRIVFHQISSNNRYINNVIHYTVQIFLKDILNKTRGYIKIGNSEIELKPELDGNFFSAQLDSEELYQILNLNSINGVEVVIVDENGIEDSLPLDINFTQPDKPSSLLSFDEILADDSLKLFKGDLSDFDEVTDLQKDLCNDFGIQTLYVVKSDKSDTTTPLNKIIFSNPLKKSYFSKYKGTSQLDTKPDGYSNIPINYTDNCEKSEDTAQYEGIRIGKSDENLSIFYKKSPSFSDSEKEFPDVMYIKVNSNIVKLDFDSSYRGAIFYVIDDNNAVYKGSFIPETYNSVTTPYTLLKIIE